MRSTLLLFVIFIASITVPLTLSGGDRIRGGTYVLVVERDEANDAPSVEFSGAYASHDSATSPKLTMLRGSTPFEMEVSGTTFLGMFQAGTENVRLRVTLKKYVDGRLMGSAVGSGLLNLVHGEQESIGYGLPDGRASVSGIQDILDIQSRQK